MGFFSDLADGLTGQTAANAAKDAARVQAEAIRSSMAYMQPYYQGGVQAQNRLMSLLGLSGDPQAEGYGSMARDFGMQDFQQDPGYAFRMSEGLKALERSAAGRGGAASGAAMKGITQYGQNLASQEYQNAFNRYMANRQSRLSPLQNLMGVGAGAASGLMGGTRDVGDAQASGIVGAANAQQQGINNMLNLGMMAAGFATGNPVMALGGMGRMGGGGQSVTGQGRYDWNGQAVDQHGIYDPNRFA